MDLGDGYPSNIQNAMKVKLARRRIRFTVFSWQRDLIKHGFEVHCIVNDLTKAQGVELTQKGPKCMNLAKPSLYY